MAFCQNGTEDQVTDSLQIKRKDDKSGHVGKNRQLRQRKRYARGRRRDSRWSVRRRGLRAFAAVSSGGAGKNADQAVCPAYQSSAPRRGSGEGRSLCRGALREMAGSFCGGEKRGGGGSETQALLAGGSGE